MLEKCPANGSGNNSVEIQISGLFNISVQKSNRKPCSETLEGVVSIPMPPGENKGVLIERFIQIFKNGRRLELRGRGLEAVNS